MITVVGGGVAGLSAACSLLSSDRSESLKVLLLEAAPFCGGRVRTIRTAEGLLLEEGAGWLHGGVEDGLKEDELNPVSPLLPPGSLRLLGERANGSALSLPSALSSALNQLPPNPWVHAGRDFFTFLHPRLHSSEIEAIVDEATAEFWREEQKGHREREALEGGGSDSDEGSEAPGPLTRFLEAWDKEHRESIASACDPALKPSIKAALSTILACWFGGDLSSIQPEDRGYALNEDGCRGDYEGCHAAVVCPEELVCPLSVGAASADPSSCRLCEKVREALYPPASPSSTSGDGTGKGVGMSAIIANLLHRCFEKGGDRFSLLFNREVEAIRYNPSSSSPSTTGPLQIHCTDGSIFPSAHAIVALPLNVVKNPSRISFFPPLPDKFTAAMAGVAASQYKKVYCCFESAPLPQCTTPFVALLGDGGHDADKGTEKERPVFTLVENTAVIKTASASSPAASPSSSSSSSAYFVVCGILFGSGVFKNTEKEEPWSDEECVEGLLTQLGRHAAASQWPHIPPLKHSHVTHWESERLTGNGAYSYLPAGVKDGEKLERDLESGCFLPLHKLAASSFSALPPQSLPTSYLAFAGEAFHFDYMGSLHGAYLSGQQAAKKVLKVATPAGGKKGTGAGAAGAGAPGSK